MFINPGLQAFFLPLVAMSKVRRGRPMALLANLDLGGWVGTANLVYTGHGGATFNLRVDNRKVFVNLGARTRVDGTVTMSVDEFSERSYPEYQGGTSLQRWRRELLRGAMEAEGFSVYAYEWWHFDYDGWERYRIGNQVFGELLHP